MSSALTGLIPNDGGAEGLCEFCSRQLAPGCARVPSLLQSPAEMHGWHPVACQHLRGAEEEERLHEVQAWSTCSAQSDSQTAQPGRPTCAMPITSSVHDTIRLRICKGRAHRCWQHDSQCRLSPGGRALGRRGSSSVMLHRDLTLPRPPFTTIFVRVLSP